MKLFKDLPNTDTPINAEMLNQIQDNLVVVSATEPTGDNREKVWIQKGKNLLDKNNVLVMEYFYINTTDMTYAVSDEKVHLIVFKCKQNQTYTISKQAGNYFRIATSTNAPSQGTKINQTLANHTATKQTITTGLNDNYIGIYIGEDDLTTMVNSLQIEYGTETTKYEEYIEPKIYVLNDNDVYEEFISKKNLVNYSTGEQRIGTWINGKPLYEKVIDGITPNTTTDTKVFDIPNIATLVNIKGIIANWLPINSIVSPENSSILYFQPDGFMMAIGSSQMNKPFRAIVEYTKTTD